MASPSPPERRERGLPLALGAIHPPPGRVAILNNGAGDRRHRVTTTRPRPMTAGSTRSAGVQPAYMERVLQHSIRPLRPSLRMAFLMDLDSLVAEVQPGRDFLVAVTLSHKAQHFAL